MQHWSSRPSRFGLTFGSTLDKVGHDDSGALRYASLRHEEGRVLVQPDLPDELHGSHLGQG